MPRGLTARTGTPQPPTQHNAGQQNALKPAHLGQRGAFVTVTGTCCLQRAYSGSLRAFSSSPLQKCEQRNTNRHAHLRLCQGSKGTHRTHTKLRTECTKPVPKHTRLGTETPLQLVLCTGLSAVRGRHATLGNPHPPAKVQDWTESFNFLLSSLLMSLSDRTYSG